MICIFCDIPNHAVSIEHIVPESLGNKHYLMPRGTVCDLCNTRFCASEKKVLEKTILSFLRAQNAVTTKAGKHSKGKIKDFEFEGSSNFVKDLILIKSIGEENTKQISTNGTITITLPSFEKCADAMAKVLLKIGLESIFFSQKVIYDKYNFEALKEFLILKNNKDWPFIKTLDRKKGFKSIPTFSDKYELNKTKIRLTFNEFDSRYSAFQILV
jgi:hypothetical protein